MKKIFTLITVLTAAFTASAKDYVDNMSISLNGGDPNVQTATVSATRAEDGDNISYEIVLKDFSFNNLKIGDVTISGVAADDSEGMGGYSFFRETTKEAQITNGGYIAGLLGNKVTVTIKDGSCINDDKLYLDIALPVAIGASTINVTAQFGTKPNFPVSYTDNLVVTAMGSTMPAQTATIIVTKQDNGKYTLALKNFELTGVMTVGTVEMADVDATEENGVIKLTTKQTVTIKDGDDPNITWAMSGIPVDVDMTADMTADKLQAEINILYTIPGVFEMPINVKFGYPASGLGSAVTVKGVEKIYDINGNNLNSTRKGLNIIRKADGTTVKVMKR